MQGLPNFVVYLLPKLRKVRRREPGAGWYKWVAKSLARDRSASMRSRRGNTSMDGVVNPSRINDPDEFSGFDEESFVDDNNEEATTKLVTTGLEQSSSIP